MGILKDILDVATRGVFAEIRQVRKERREDPCGTEAMFRGRGDSWAKRGRKVLAKANYRKADRWTRRCELHKKTQADCGEEKQ